MDSHSLKSASVYLNNLLVARGLLRNGKSIDFARPDHARGGTDATMAKVINLVHDLVLRRDRETEQREVLASNIRTLRAEEAQRLLDIDRAESKNLELARNASTLEAQERTLKTTVRKAEAQARDLKEQMLKMKSTMDQVRAKCLSDVRRRDVELEKLKTHLASTQRGKRDMSGNKSNSLHLQSALSRSKEVRPGPDVNSVDWSLENESTDFLAALLTETSTENVALRKMVGDTMETLKHLTALDENQSQEVVDDEEDGIGIPGQDRKSRQKAKIQDSGELISCKALAAQMNDVLGHCRAILKDPSFVSIEEVQIREDEIIKLREGWEKMAGRWREAVTMMDTWRKRIMDGGDSVNLQELTNLGFGRSTALLPNGEAIMGNDEDPSSALFDDDEGDVPAEAVDDTTFTEEATKEVDTTRRSRHELPSSESHEEEFDEDSDSDFDAPLDPSPKRLAASPARRGLKLPRPIPVFGASVSNTCSASSRQSLNLSLGDSADSGIVSVDGSVDDNQGSAHVSHKPRFARALQQANKENLASPSLLEKLAAVEADAKEALNSSMLEQATHKRKSSTQSNRQHVNRRRSALNPEELATLMGFR